MKLINKNDFVLASLAMDLKRIALAIYNDSNNTARRFTEEAKKRKNEVEVHALPQYVQSIFKNIDQALTHQSDRTAEDLLMYSQLIQNYVVHYGK